MENPISWAIVGAVLSILLLLSIPLRFIPFLFILSIFFDKFHWEVLSFTIRPSQVVGAFLVIKWLLVKKYKSKIEGALPNPLIIPFLLYVGFSIISALLNAPDTHKSLQLCLMLVVLLSPVIAMVDILQKRELYERVMRFYIGAGVISAVVGLLGYIALVGFGYESVVATGELGGRICGTQHGAGDHFGIQMMLFAIIMISHLSVRSALFSFNRQYLYILLFLLAMLLSFKRSAWLSALIGITCSWFLLANQKQRAIFARRSLGWITGIAIVIGLLNWGLPGRTYEAGGIYEMMVHRASRILDFKEGTGQFRLTVCVEALQNWQAHLLLGNGPGSMGDYLGWIGNVFVRSLHDVGIFGLFSVILIWLTIFWQGLRVIYFPIDNRLKGYLIGMFSSCLALLSVNMVDDQFLLNLFWVHISLTMTTINLAKMTRNDKKQNSSMLIHEEGRLLRLYRRGTPAGLEK